MSEVVDFVEDTWDAATDLVSDVGGAILDAAGDVVSFVVDEIIILRSETV